ncbi:MAG TPA: DUF5615 family PIN-like protein [Spirochaetota bacterium]|nr:DUF5615 family PIN-like protein [Spirochaetota bacterium]HPY87952.1 DUF5615 family PIN-like protein [Spirochaetota bacterium]HQB60130.1 DUF5615 family PIN-like protein [Spirochaetota bacterium]
MIYFLDENFPKKSSDLLKARGNQIIDVRGTDKEGLSDVDLFYIAKHSKSIFLTTDKDFFHTIHLLNKPHSGIVVIALRQPNADNIIDKLKWFLDNYSKENIENKCFLITDNKCNIY